MTYKLEIHQKPTYLHAVVTGQNSKENVKLYIYEIIRECAARHCFQVLIEERLEGPRLGTLDVFDIAADGSDLFRRIFQAVAYVDVNQEGGLMKFAENVAVNRGLPLAVFTTVVEAERWLLDRTRGDAEPHAAADADQPHC